MSGLTKKKGDEKKAGPSGPVSKKGLTQKKKFGATFETGPEWADLEGLQVEIRGKEAQTKARKLNRRT